MNIEINFEYSGGHIWTLSELGSDGYDKTIISVEIESGKDPFIFGMSRQLTKIELEKLVSLIYNETVKNEQ